MKYMRLLEPSVIVPQHDGSHKNPLDMSAGSIVGVMKHNKPSLVTGRANEVYVRWQETPKRVGMGWLPKTARLVRSVNTKSLRFIPRQGDDRLTAWDTLRYAALIHKGWTVRRWLEEIGDVQVPLIHAVIRELGGKVPRSDDPRLAIRLALKQINPKENTNMSRNRAEIEEQDEDVTPTKSSKKSKKGKTSSKKASSKKESTREGGPGRTSMYSGKVIVKLVKENPRREDTHGYNSWELLRKGMTYEQYIEAGGRRVDLAWDILKKNVKLVKRGA